MKNGRKFMSYIRHITAGEGMWTFQSFSIRYIYRLSQIHA